VANVVPAVLHQEALAQELWLGLLFTEILWMMLLAIDFTSMTWSRQKAGLLKKATLCLNNKLNN
jgi:hypothetical protein